MHKIKTPLRGEDINPITQRILDRSNWFSSVWVQNTFGLYYLLLDLDRLDLVINKRFTKKISQSLAQQKEMHAKTAQLIKGMQEYLLDANKRYCDWHEVSEAPITRYEENWKEVVREYEFSRTILNTMTPEVYNIHQILDTNTNLADTVCASSLIGYGSEIYETLSFIDQMRWGPLTKRYFQKLRER